MSKKLVLKGRIKATLHLNQIDNDYYIWAKDENNNKVGFCQFNLTYVYEKFLDSNFRANYAKYNKMPIEKVPYYLDFTVSDPEKFKIVGNKIKLTNGKVYNIKNTICELQKIEILDERFFQVGLGSSMLKSLESIANQNNCCYIEARYSPFGNFQIGTLSFYKNNGFEFYKHPKYKLNYVKKYLQKTNEFNI